MLIRCTTSDSCVGVTASPEARVGELTRTMGWSGDHRVAHVGNEGRRAIYLFELASTSERARFERAFAAMASDPARLADLGVAYLVPVDARGIVLGTVVVQLASGASPATLDSLRRQCSAWCGGATVDVDQVLPGSFTLRLDSCARAKVDTRELAESLVSSSPGVIRGAEPNRMHPVSKRSTSAQ